MRSVKIAISVHNHQNQLRVHKNFDWLMSRAHALSQKTISLDLHKALDGKYCQRKTGMLEKKGMNAPPAEAFVRSRALLRPKTVRHPISLPAKRDRRKYRQGVMLSLGSADFMPFEGV